MKFSQACRSWLKKVSAVKSSRESPHSKINMSKTGSDEDVIVCYQCCRKQYEGKIGDVIKHRDMKSRLYMAAE